MKTQEEVNNEQLTTNNSSLEKKKKRKYSTWKFFVAFAVIMGAFATIRHAFAIEIPLKTGSRVEGNAAWLSSEQPEEVIEEEQTMEYLQQYKEDEMKGDEDAEDEVTEDDIELPDDEAWYTEVPDAVPYDTTHHETIVNAPEDNLVMESPTDEASHGKGAHRVRGVWSYAECFPDIQDVQIVAAQKHGITPVSNRKEAEKLVKSHKLVNISHSPFYKVDDLTHSIPYLVPRAQHLLNTICLNFIDSCQVKGLPLHLPIVTSVLRTTDDVSNLQKGNKNATTNSCHCYGTTVDIAYNRFMPMTGTYYPNSPLLRWDEPMKQVLSEVLNDLRKQGKCYVKYERKQGCFHLTCR